MYHNQQQYDHIQSNIFYPKKHRFHKWIIYLACHLLDHCEQVLRPKPSEKSFSRDEIAIMVTRLNIIVAFQSILVAFLPVSIADST